MDASYPIANIDGISRFRIRFHTREDGEIMQKLRSKSRIASHEHKCAFP